MALDNPALTFALALVVGIIGQIVAWHLRVPGIVLLLALGVQYLMTPKVDSLLVQRDTLQRLGLLDPAPGVGPPQKPEGATT